MNINQQVKDISELEKETNMPAGFKNKRIYSSDKEDVISPERTPVRNKVVHEQLSHLNTDYKKH